MGVHRRGGEEEIVWPCWLVIVYLRNETAVGTGESRRQPVVNWSPWAAAQLISSWKGSENFEMIA